MDATDFVPKYQLVRNADTIDIPPYAAVEVVGLDTDGVVKVRRPTADNLGAIMFVNEGGIPLAATDGTSAEGMATFNTPAVVLTRAADGSPAAEDSWGTLANTFTLAKGKIGLTALMALPHTLGLFNRAGYTLASYTKAGIVGLANQNLGQGIKKVEILELRADIYGLPGIGADTVNTGFQFRQYGFLYDAGVGGLINALALVNMGTYTGSIETATSILMCRQIIVGKDVSLNMGGTLRAPGPSGQGWAVSMCDNGNQTFSGQIAYNPPALLNPAFNFPTFTAAGYVLVDRDIGGITAAFGIRQAGFIYTGADAVTAGGTFKAGILIGTTASLINLSSGVTGTLSTALLSGPIDGGMITTGTIASGGIHGGAF